MLRTFPLMSPPLTFPLSIKTDVAMVQCLHLDVQHTSPILHVQKRTLVTLRNQLTYSSSLFGKSHPPSFTQLLRPKLHWRLWFLTFFFHTLLQIHQQIFRIYHSFDISHSPYGYLLSPSQHHSLMGTNHESHWTCLFTCLPHTLTVLDTPARVIFKVKQNISFFCSLSFNVSSLRQEENLKSFPCLQSPLSQSLATSWALSLRPFLSFTPQCQPFLFPYSF